MQMGCGGRATRQYERGKGIETCIQLIDFRLYTIDLRLDDAQRFPLHFLASIGRGEIRSEIEKIVLNAKQHAIQIGIGGIMQPRHADQRIGFVNRAIGFNANAQIMFSGGAVPVTNPVVPSSPVRV